MKMRYGDILITKRPVLLWVSFEENNAKDLANGEFVIFVRDEGLGKGIYVVSRLGPGNMNPLDVRNIM